eukprot:TRINITY_DN17017_c0_g1_i1.p1 TRINITY_DN17017_c0_g1~~TRINITY_DN17017_c0_g1_i1.p1  ORF type:complete len:428 (-),score=63.11 TRINITY_DN17017_c0_g1_i1:269-1552(-)
MLDRAKKKPRQVRKDSLGQSLCGFLTAGGLFLVLYCMFGIDRRGKDAALRQRTLSQSAVASDNLVLPSAEGNPPKPEPPEVRLHETQVNQQAMVEKITKSKPAYVKGAANSNECTHGTLQIETVEECEGAAQVLGLQFNSYDPVRELDPQGCQYRIPDNDVYYNSHDTGAGHPDRKPLCREAGSPTASPADTLDGPSEAAAAAQGASVGNGPATSASTGGTVVAPSTPTSVKAAATPQASYVMAEGGENECPKGSGPLEDSESCQSAAEVLGKPFLTDDPKSENDPRGCQFRVPDQDVYFNSHDVGKPNTQRQVVCREGAPSPPPASKVQVTQTLTSTPDRKYVFAETDTTDCPAGSKPVENEEACRAAAAGLGKSFYVADFVSDQAKLQNFQASLRKPRFQSRRNLVESLQWASPKPWIAHLAVVS